MLTALTALSFAAGLRFALLRWRELDIAEKRIQAAVDDAVRELRTGVARVNDEARGARPRDDLADAEQQATAEPPHSSRVVQAKSDPPRPSL
jgi:hypothetical protein